MAAVTRAKMMRAAHLACGSHFGASRPFLYKAMNAIIGQQSNGIARDVLQVKSERMPTIASVKSWSSIAGLINKVRSGVFGQICDHGAIGVGE